VTAVFQSFAASAFLPAARCVAKSPVTTGAAGAAGAAGAEPDATAEPGDGSFAGAGSFDDDFPQAVARTRTARTEVRIGHAYRECMILGYMAELTREVAGVSLATQRNYTIKRPFWSFMERRFRVFTGDGQLFMYVQHPVLKLREEFTVYADEGKTKPLLLIKSKQIVAINFSYDITDIATGQLLGSVQKKGLSSIVRDKFILLDPHGAEIGYAEEQGASIMRRFFPWLTSKHAIFVGGAQAAFIRQIFHFFVKEFTVEIQESSGLDPRFALAVALLALMAEARREDSR
jgi:uncharacterized protein YxjI